MCFCHFYYFFFISVQLEFIYLFLIRFSLSNFSTSKSTYLFQVVAKFRFKISSNIYFLFQLYFNDQKKTTTFLIDLVLV